MDSKLVRGAIAAGALAALAWGVKVFVEAIVLVYSVLQNIGFDSDVSDRVILLIAATFIVAVLAGAGYYLIDRRLKPKEESAEE
ncbi:MAG: hypothetical protein OXE50_13755 [Chloroflexi bacterium]|nr:hypothetical protein [Chloroflexota bacterium]